MALVPVVLLSCYSYSTIRVVHRVPSVPAECKKSTVVRGKKVPNDESPAHITALYPSSKEYRTVYVRKYLARTSSRGPAGSINNRGVALAEKGHFREAVYLFRSVLREHGDSAPVLNNLGVLSEIAGNRERAFGFYSRACLLEPDNERFRHNFLYMGRHEGTLSRHQKHSSKNDVRK